MRGLREWVVGSVSSRIDANLTCLHGVIPLFHGSAPRSAVLATALVSILAACGPMADSFGSGPTAESLDDGPTAESLDDDPTAESLGGVMICEHYDDSPIPPGYDANGCWSPTEYFERAPEVIPEVDAVAPLLRIEASGDVPMGIEGTLYFVRVVSPTGRVVLERDWEWPSLEQKVPPGAYQVTAYSRACDGNCDQLDPTMLSCTVDLLAEPSMSYTMTYRVAPDRTISCAAALGES